MALRRPKKTAPRAPKIPIEVVYFLVVVVAAFCGLSLVAVDYTGRLGGLTNYILQWFFGRVGALTIVGTVLVAGLLALFSSQQKARRLYYFMAVTSLAVLVASELSIPLIRRDFPFRVGELGGGFIGRVLGGFIFSLLGQVGAWILVGVVVFLSFLWVTGISLASLLRAVKSLWQKAWQLVQSRKKSKPKPVPEKTQGSPTVHPAIIVEELTIKTPHTAKPFPVIHEPLVTGAIEQLMLPITDYQLPSLNLLNRALRSGVVKGSREDKENVRILEETLLNFGIKAKVMDMTRGPTCSRYELHLAPGTKVSKITSLSNDLAMSLASDGVRIEAPIPGKAAIGIEVPNKARGSVFLRDVVESAEFTASISPLTVALGKDVEGTTIVADLAQMPHLLIAGATGAGKSVCINAIICSILFKATPKQVKMMLIDPKVVELSQYNGIPHLIAPVLNHPKKAAAALKWAALEMEKRYAIFARAGVRDIARYNERALEKNLEHMPYQLIIIDELADLMMVARADVEDAICRLAQMARAAGMHLVIGTQRPSTDVITGLIKANIPSRLSFTVSSAIDSRVILDMSGAEKLLGQGDMLFLPVGQSKAKRVQGSFVSNREIEKIVDHVSAQGEAEYAPGLRALDEVDTTATEGDGGQDERFDDAVRVIVETGQASVSMLQRRMRLGYTRAARIVDQMESAGIVGPSDGSRPRQINKNHPSVTQIVESNKR